MKTICLIPTDLRQGRFGHVAALGDKIVDQSVLGHTVRRAAAIPGVDRIVLVHPSDQPEAEVRSLLDQTHHRTRVPVETFADNEGLTDRLTPMRQAARKWAMTGWRGGFGSACVYDELLPAGPLVEAMDRFKAELAVLVRADWCCFDPALSGLQLQRLAEAPESMKLTFSQAPPGLGSMCVTRKVLGELSEHDAGFGDIFGYNPRKPTPDPITRDVCLAVPAEVRGCFERFVHDTRRGREVIHAVAEHLGSDFAMADPSQITQALTQVRGRLSDQPPRYVNLELTPERRATGPITPGHHVRFDRAAMDSDLAVNLVRQIGHDDPSETALLIGGLGDALLHADWPKIVEAAHDSGVFGIGIETDLLCEQSTLERLLNLPLDVISVRLNADSAQTYQQLMGIDGFDQVMANLQCLFDKRKEMSSRLPWIIPRLAKTAENVAEMETFFERWTRIAGHAVIESPPIGHGQMPDFSPVPMTPPRPLKTPLHDNQMVILSHGLVTTDPQDWFGDQALGSASTARLARLRTNRRQSRERPMAAA